MARHGQAGEGGREAKRGREVKTPSHAPTPLPLYLATQTTQSSHDDCLAGWLLLFLFSCASGFLGERVQDALNASDLEVTHSSSQITTYISFQMMFALKLMHPHPFTHFTGTNSSRSSSIIKSAGDGTGVAWLYLILPSTQATTKSSG